MSAFVMNAGKLTGPMLQQALKNRQIGQGTGRKHSKETMLAELKEHEQKAVEIEKLPLAGVGVELLLLGWKTVPKGAIGELRELVKQELVKQAAAAAAAAAEQAAKEAAAGGQQEGQVQAGTPNKNKKKRKHESVEAALSPVKVTASEMRNAYYKGRPKKGPTRQQQFNSDYSTFTAEFVRAKENGKKTAKKAQKLETGENAYMLKPVIGQRLEVGFSVCIAGAEKKTLTWVPLAYVIANKQVHPGMKEAAQFARVPSKTIAELEQLDEAGEAYCEAVDQHNAEQSDADSESGSDSSGSESDTDGSDSDV